MAVLSIPEEHYVSITIIDPQSRTEKRDDKFNIIDPQSRTEKRDDKFNIIDVKLELVNEIINIEMQMCVKPFMEDRILYGLAKNITNQKFSGHNYKLKKVIAILITDYMLIKEHNNYNDAFGLISKETKHTFNENIEVYTLELPKLPEQEENTLSWKWLKFIKSETLEDFEMIAEKLPEIKKAVGILKELSADEETRLLAHQREMEQWQYWAAMGGSKEQGIEIGIKQEKLALTKKMLQANEPIEKIEAYTGLSIEIIKNLETIERQ